jgi:hypothetical protein
VKKKQKNKKKKKIGLNAAAPLNTPELHQLLERMDLRIRDVFSSLPVATCLMVVSGQGDARRYTECAFQAFFFFSFARVPSVL